MNRAIEIYPYMGVDYEPFKLEVKKPGHVRTVLTVLEEPSSIIPTSMGKPAPVAMKPVPGIMFEVDPNGETELRNFVWLPVKKALNFPGKLVFRATYVDETTGMPLILYEAVKDR